MKTGRRKLGLLAALMLVASLGLSGCGDSNVFESMADDDTTAARQEKALDKINDGDFEAAIAILEDLDADDPEVKRYLASAYAGKAGFDTLDLVEILSLDDEATSEEEEKEMFDTIGELFGAGDDGKIPSLGDKIDAMSKSLEILTEGNPEGLAAEDTEFQAGLYGAVQAVLLSVDMLGGASIDEIKGDKVDIPGALDTGWTVDKATELNNSLKLVAAASDDLIKNFDAGEDEENDMAAEMDELLVDIGFTGDDSVDRTELTNFLEDL